MRELDVHGLTVDQAIKTFIDFYNHSFRTNQQAPIRIVREEF
jgi:DNA-nicking Smr family endonuclease